MNKSIIIVVIFRLDCGTGPGVVKTSAQVHLNTWNHLRYSVSLIEPVESYSGGGKGDPSDFTPKIFEKGKHKREKQKKKIKQKKS